MQDSNNHTDIFFKIFDRNLFLGIEKLFDIYIDLITPHFIKYFLNKIGYTQYRFTRFKLFDSQWGTVFWITGPWHFLWLTVFVFLLMSVFLFHIQEKKCSISLSNTSIKNKSLYSLVLKLYDNKQSRIKLSYEIDFSGFSFLAEKGNIFLCSALFS